MNFWERVYEGRMLDESNRLISQAREAKEAAATIVPSENELSPDAMSVSFSHIDATLYAAGVAIQHGAEILNGWSPQL